MTYFRHHYKCQPGCKVYTSYVRIKNKWRRIGKYHTKCGLFKSDMESKDQIKPAKEKPILPTSTDLMMRRKMTIYRPYQVSDKELLELCNSLGKA